LLVALAPTGVEILTVVVPCSDSQSPPAHALTGRRESIFLGKDSFLHQAVA
jgi:hypothetical protein